MGCTVKVATRVLPPIIVELAEGSKEKYRGPELNNVGCILDKLNLSKEKKFWFQLINHSLKWKPN